MDGIKNAIVRVGRRVRALDSLKERNFEASKYKNTKRHPIPDKPINLRQEFPRLRLTNETLDKAKPLLQSYEKRKFQEFLKPLGMTDLKVFTEKKPYNVENATIKWRLKNSNNNIIMHQEYLNNQDLFNRMIELLIELTPEKLRGQRSDTKTVEILHDYEDYVQLLKYDIPKVYFGEVPKIDKNMLANDFDQYIYFLTNCRFLYENSSSLNGIINDVLLYTHKLDNLDFKTKRSIKTYNNLIKWYGYDKNQSLFARLILVLMEKDGISPNIETINNLLKIITLTSQIRSVSNQFELILKYLRLCKHYNLQVNLITWTRIYQLIQNIYLKELFLNQVSVNNIPITKDLIYNVVDDYSKTCKTPQELINFLQNELMLTHWQTDSKLLNKILYFTVARATNQDILKLIEHMKLTTSSNEHFMKYILEGIRDNSNLNDNEKANTMLIHYIPESPVVIKLMITQLAKVTIDGNNMVRAVNKLVNDFNCFTQYYNFTLNMQALKYYAPKFELLQTKFSYHNLQLSENNYVQGIIQLNNKIPFTIPMNFLRGQKIKKIRSISKFKLINQSISIQERLKQRGLI